MKYIFLVNPVSGGGKNLRLIDDIRSEFSSIGRGSSLEIVYTSKRGEAQRLSAGFADIYGKNCVIVCCGGDGTIRECANGLVHTDTPMAVLPFGSGNDFASKLYGKKPSAYKAAEELGFVGGLPRFFIRHIDLGRVTANGSTFFFIGIMSLGFDTRVEILADKISRKIPKAASMAYTLGLMGGLFGEKTYCINARLDVKEKNGDIRTIKRRMAYTLMAVCNSSYYGGGFCPAPNAKLNDGIFEFLVAAPCNLVEICNLAPMYKMGVADISSKINLTNIVGGSFFSSDGNTFVLNCDGENTVTQRADFSVEHKALRLCVPILSEGVKAFR